MLQEGNKFDKFKEFDEERIEQIRFGRKKILEELNLQGKILEEKIKPSNKPTLYRKKNHHEKKIGHESCFAKMVAERREIELIFKDLDEIVIGELLEFDDKALRVKRSTDSKIIWYFKDALIGFSEVGK